MRWTWWTCQRTEERDHAGGVEGRRDPNQLPHELLVRVLEKLDDKDLGRIARTCRSMRRACQDETLWKKKCMQRGIASNVVLGLRRETNRKQQGPTPVQVSWAECYRIQAHQKHVRKDVAKKNTEEAVKRHEVGAKLTRCLASRELDHKTNGPSFSQLLARAKKKIHGKLHALKQKVGNKKREKKQDQIHEEDGSCRGRPYTQVMTVPPAVKGKVRADFVLVKRIKQVEPADP
mmetsp:Transcript_10589/g.65184  ORF Transcript_10589/g.65184 Transcript_10589/m.65184 type:complete len:233 (-) Transcript_10589:9859-10557(-)